MNNEERNRYILIFVVVIMLLIIIILGICVYLNKKSSDKVVSLKQVYVSDYDLYPLDDSYFYGIKDNTLKLIVKSNGNEVYLSDNGVYFEYLYPMSDDKYMFYGIKNNVLKGYSFDGEEVKEFIQIDDVKYIMPILYEDIDSTIIIGFIENKDDKTYLYSLDGSIKKELNDIDVIGDSFIDYKYYVHDRDNIVIKKDDKYGTMDFLGNINIDCKYQDVYSYTDNRFVVKYKNKYGIIDETEKVLIPIKYNIIKAFKDGVLLGNKKLALYDSSLNRISKMEINSNINNYIIREDNSLRLDKVKDMYLISNNYQEDLNDYIYHYHDLYILKNNKMKSINEIGYSIDNVKFTYDKDVLTIYNKDFVKIKDIKINIDNIRNVYKLDDNYYIEYVNNSKIKYKVINEKGEKVNNKYGKLLIYDKDYYGYKKGNKFYLVDKDDKVLEETTGNDIIISGYHIIIDNVLYELK